MTTIDLYLLVILSAPERFVTSFESCVVEFGLKQSLEFCNESISVSSVKVLTHSFSSSAQLLGDYVLNVSMYFSLNLISFVPTFRLFVLSATYYLGVQFKTNDMG
jgi:Tat protein secretion system quality control protein TatD with DNase activity